MREPIAYLKHAKLALASYATLDTGVPRVVELVAAGMVDDDAQGFATVWRVVDQYSSASTGLSATVFQEIESGKRYLAIRGTDDLLDVLTDAVHIAGIGTTLLAPQYVLLRTKIEQWLAIGVLPSTFTVAGHSLGGFLATGVAADFASNVEHTYLYNAPGVNGLSGGATARILSALGVSSPIETNKVSNIKADAGSSLIAGLGLQISPPIWIAIENQFLSDVAAPPAARNHSQRVLTDALAVYAGYQALDPELTISQIGALLKSASANNNRTLEEAVSIPGRLFVPTLSTPTEDRDALHANLAGWQSAMNDGGLGGTLRIAPLGDAAKTHLEARRPGADSQAVRYALKNLNPFAILGASSLYAQHNQNGELDRYSPVTHAGTLTDEWLKDRAAFLAWRIQKNRNDTPDDAVLLRRDSGVESYLFTDKTLKNAGGQDFSIRVVGGNVLQQIDPIRITFGSEQSEAIEGGKYSDRLYAEAGDDSLAGGEGDDYLEGGAGHDTYRYVSDNALGGYDTLFDLDGRGSIVFDGQTLQGGSREAGNRYRSADGHFTYLLVPGSNGRGSLIINDVLEVRDFADGDLGIGLGSSLSSPGETAYQVHYQQFRTPLDAPADDDRYRGGSDFNDEFQSGRYEGAGQEFVPGLEGGMFVGKAGDDAFLGSFVYEDVVWGGPGNDVLKTAALGQSLTLETSFEGDFASGGAGTDEIIGGASADRLYGDFDTLLYIEHLDDPNSSLLPVRLGLELILDFDESPGLYRIRWTDDAAGILDSRWFGTLEEAIDYGLGLGDESDLDTFYDDVIDGGGGDDYLEGGNGADHLISGDGNDHIVGDGPSSNYVTSGDLRRSQFRLGRFAHLLGLPGDDLLEGGEGNDRLEDQISGNDVLDGGAGNDLLINVDTVLSAGFFADGRTRGNNSATNVLDGGAGDDVIRSTSLLDEGFDWLAGGDGNDDIVFDGGSASIDAGPGDDRLSISARTWVYIDSGEGNDVATVAGPYAQLVAGAGSDRITSFATQTIISQHGNQAGDHDEIALPNWTGSDTRLSRDENDLVLSSVYSGDTAVFENWFQGEANEVDAISLADVTWFPEHIEAALDTTENEQLAQSDRLSYSGMSRVIQGGLGRDILTASYGAAVLDGGEGDDALMLEAAAKGFLVAGSGGDVILSAGSDTIAAFNREDGQDYILVQGPTTVSLGGGISFADLSIATNGEDMVLDLGAGDSIVLSGAMTATEGGEQAPFPLILQIVSPAGGEMYDLRSGTMEAQFRPSAAIGGLLAQTYALIGNLGHLSESDIAQVLDDPAFGRTPQAFIAEPKVAPLVWKAIPDQTANAGMLFAFPLPDEVFIDWDSEDPLVMSLQAEEGGDLPEWIEFDGEVIRGTPGRNDAGSWILQIVAEDVDGLSAVDEFTITVTDGNHVPLISVAKDTVLLGEAVPASLLFSASDEDGDALVSYEFRELTEGHGHLALRGNAIDQGSPLSVSASNLETVQFVASSTIGSDGLQVRAFDGMAWSAWTEWTIHSWPHSTNASPQISPKNVLIPAGQAFALASLFDVHDADGDMPVRYEVSKDSAAAGEWRLNGVMQNSGPVVLSPSDLEAAQFIGNSLGGIDRIAVRAYDGIAWGEWRSWDLLIEPQTSTQSVEKTNEEVRSENNNATVTPALTNEQQMPPVAAEPQTAIQLPSLDEPDSLTSLPPESGELADEELPPSAAPESIYSTARGNSPVVFEDDLIALQPGVLPGQSFVASVLPSAAEGYSDAIAHAPAAARTEVGTAVAETKRSESTLQALQETLDEEKDASAAQTHSPADVRNEDTPLVPLSGQRATIEELSAGLSRWEIADALLNFHLQGEEHKGAASDFALPFGWAGLTRLSIDHAQAMIGVPGFGREAHHLQVFTGLQEGFAQLS